jgi:hypothetical protein
MSIDLTAPGQPFAGMTIEQIKALPIRAFYSRLDRAGMQPTVDVQSNEADGSIVLQDRGVYSISHDGMATWENLP